MGGTILCSVCGTVNVGVFARCIACGQELAHAATPVLEDSDPGPPGDPDVEIQQEREVTGPVLVPKSAGLPSRVRSNQAQQASIELESASYRQTVVEMQVGPDTAAIRPAPAAAPAARRRKGPRSIETGPAHTTPESKAPTRFVARLLLPEGDRRTIEIGSRPLAIGSGLDEIGLSGDPRMGAGEARLFLAEGRLWLDPAVDAANVYRRIDREVKLRDGDVVLVGDIAAMFTRSAPPAAVDAARVVLGGSANAPCGRLVFLRRDGSPGPVHDLPAGKTVLGRTDGHLNFPTDSRLSRRHALFFASDQGVTLEDMDSRNGTYLRVRERLELHADDALRIGSAGLQIRAK